MYHCDHIVVFGTFCVNWGNSRKLLAKLSVLRKSTKRSPWKSRTSVSGFVMILVPEPITCTVNTVTWPSLPLSPNAIGIWELVIVLELTAFKSSESSQLPLAKPDVLLSSKCTIPRSSSLCLLASKRALDHFSRPRDQIPTSFKFWLPSEDENKGYSKIISEHILLLRKPFCEKLLFSELNSSLISVWNELFFTYHCIYKNSVWS